jgi:hypothetical protein
MFDEFGKDIKGIDWFLTNQLHWHAHRELILDITGDWSALANAGQALIAIGDAADTVAANIKANLAILDQHWEGAAAQSAMALLTRYHEGVQEEAPINRTAGRVYMFIAEEVRKVAGKLISLLNDLVKKLKSILPDVASDVVPCDAITLVDKHRVRFDAARGLVQTLRMLFDDARVLLDALKDPVKAATRLVPELNRVQESYDMITKALDEEKKWLAIANDVADMGDPTEFVNAPHEQYRLPANAEAAGA